MYNQEPIELDAANFIEDFLGPDPKLFTKNFILVLNVLVREIPGYLEQAFFNQSFNVIAAELLKTASTHLRHVSKTPVFFSVAARFR